MKFEWDDNKNDLNIEKHGYDFIDAYLVFELPMLTKIDTRFDYNEDRIIGVGILKNNIVVIVFTENEKKDTIRVISLRKANKYERTAYKNNC